MIRQAQHDTERLLHFDGECRSGVAAGNSGVIAGRIVAGFRACPDIHHGVGDEHRGFDRELPVAGFPIDTLGAVDDFRSST